MTESLPGTDLLRGKFPWRKDPEPGGRGREELNRAPQHQRRGGTFAPCGAPFVVAVRPKGLLQVIIGPGQSRDRIAVKEAWPVTARDFQEMCQRGGECPRASPVPRHGAQEATQATLHSRPRAVFLVGEDVGYLVDPARGDAHLRPQQGGLGQAPVEERLQPE